MDNVSMTKDIVFTSLILGVFLSIILNFNLIGALIFKGWDWIITNWIPDLSSVIIILIIYVLVHLYILYSMFTLKKLKK